jgi:hypothetical protein
LVDGHQPVFDIDQNIRVDRADAAVTVDIRGH